MKKLRYIAALLLIASLVLSPFTPVSAVSAEVGEEEAERIGEVESLRETNSETYLMSDGTYECVVYAKDKYYRDSNNALQLIDNTFVAAGSGTGLMAVTQYTNAANAFEITLSGSGTPQVSMNYNGVGVVFFPVGASKQGIMHMTASDTVVAIGGVENCSTLSQLTATGSNTAAYANVFGSADLVYVLENNALKEYIILEDSTAPNEFSFLFELDGLTMQTVDGFTHFVNGNEESVFTLGSLFAVDANGKPTDALTYDFVPVKGNDGQVIVTVTLSEDYLSDPDRAFPVVIDPTVTISSSQTADTCVCEGFPTTNYYTAAQLRTGYDSDYGRRRSYLRFDIPDSIAPGSVTNATLDMERVSGAIPTTRAYRVTAAWTSSTLTWRNSPVYTTLGQSTQSVVFREGSAWYTMNVTQIVQSWVNGNYLNHGFVVIDANESDPDHWTTWYSSDANSPHKPELIISYSDYGSRPYQAAPAGTSSNCMGYALEYKQFISGVDLNISESSLVGMTTEQMLEYIHDKSCTWITNHIGSSNYGAINNFDSDIDTGWFRVVLRVGFDDQNMNNVYDSYEKWDYHWWYQTNENQGQWADKAGSTASRRQTSSSGSVDPTSLPWLGYVVYDSQGVYFKVKDMRVISW